MDRPTRVLLLETTTHWIPSNYKLAGLDLWPQSVGAISRSRRLPGDSVTLADPVEFEIAIADFQNNNSNSRRDLAAEGATGVNMTLHMLATMAAQMQFIQDSDQLCSGFQSALSNGQLLIIIAGPYASIGKKSNYDWIPFPPCVEGVDGNPHSGPAPCVWTRSDGAIADLVRDIGADFAWSVAFDIESPTERRTDVPGEWWPKPPHLRGEPVVLARNTIGQPVALSISVGKGEIIVLPNVKDDERRTAVVKYLITKFVPAYRPALIPGSWVSTSWPSAVATQAIRLEEEERAFTAYIKERRAQLQNLRDEVVRYRSLVYAQSEELKVIVARAFSDVLGFRVTDMDFNRSELDPKVFDLLVEGYGKRLAVEVRGKEARGLAREDVDKLLKNIDRNPDFEQLNRVIVLNPACKYPLDDDRRRLHPDPVEYATNKNVCILTTPVLYEIVAHILSGRISRESVLALLHKAGELSIDERVLSTLGDGRYGEPNT